MPNLYSGTSGFAYPSWKPEFYPEKLASKKFLNYYATRLNAVEVNYTFRRLPSASTLENWVADTRAGFVFPLKAHMRITHILRVKPSEFTEVFFKAIDPLRSARRLGPVLFQLPPAMKCDEALLADFLATLPPDMRYAFEFRHVSWRLRMPEYSPDDRKEIAGRVEQLMGRGQDVYVFFKHEETPAGALYAEELLNKIQKKTAGA